MTDLVQDRGWISRTDLEAAIAAFTLMVVLVSGAVTQSVQAQTFTDLYNFTGGSDGGSPLSGLIRDAAGNLYGTTIEGGTGCPFPGCGTVFKLDTKGTETVLYSFTGEPDGDGPVGGLLRDAAGNFYGTTAAGGTYNLGTVFKLDTKGKETILHNFSGGTADGYSPLMGLVRDSAGNLYGTTFRGGIGCGGDGCGTVFKISKSGKESLLHKFSGEQDGANPEFGGLLMDNVGNLYGLTSDGDASGAGNVYKLSKSGTLRVLHSFAGGTTDGCRGDGTLAMDTLGNLYGTASECGKYGHGIVFKLNKVRKETVLHNFMGGSDGIYPEGVVLDAKGNLYGNASYGGSSDYGTVWRLNKKGRLTLLHSFTGADGDHPYGELTRANGNLYGTTFYLGTGGSGTVWKLTP